MCGLLPKRAHCRRGSAVSSDTTWTDYAQTLASAPRGFPRLMDEAELTFRWDALVVWLCSVVRHNVERRARLFPAARGAQACRKQATPGGFEVEKALRRCRGGPVDGPPARISSGPSVRVVCGGGLPYAAEYISCRVEEGRTA